MLPISVCIIAKNEEKYIEECLRRLSAYDWEIVVTDTGSTDRTVEIAHSFTPHVYHFDWINDFSAARNFCVSKASNDYILAVDCDEYLETNETTKQTIQHLTETIAPMQVGMINCLSPTADSSSDNNASSPVVHDYIARFFNRKYTHYEGAIHEQLSSVARAGLEFIRLPLTFYHAGYATLTIRKKKALRNIALLEKELTEKGADPYIYFQLGQSYFGLADYEHALSYFDQALALDVNEQEEYVQTLVESYGYCLLYLKQYQKALELEGIYSIFSKRADFVFLMGLIYMNNGLFQEAVREFETAVTIQNYAVDGVNSYKAYYNIGVIYECSGNISAATSYYKKCENYVPAAERLASIFPFNLK